MLPFGVVPVLIAVAIVGYVVGHSSGKSSSAEDRAANGSGVALGYPRGWRMARIAPGIPQLPVADVVVIAPRGKAEHAGLMLGMLPAGELAPLPKRFVATLARLPVPEVVNLVETQAYRYPRLTVPGYGRTLTLFVIPNPGRRPMLLACYASPGRSSQMRACEQSVATVTTAGAPQALQLTPEPVYASAISNAISPLDRLRASLKRELQPDVTVASARRLATELADGFAAATQALDRLYPPPPVEPAHAAVIDAVGRAHDGYLALARAIGERDPSRYVAAQKEIARAEADVDAALGSYVLLGYSSTPQLPGGVGSGAG
ncbi:MAG: hypothetical protein ACHQHO_07555 [Solirubrobacterales bacterium]